MITIRHSYGKVQEQDIERVEVALQQKLPADYRQFLLEHNGGAPEPNFFLLPSSTTDEYAMVQKFLGISPGEYDDLVRRFEVFRERLPAGWIPIAYDPGGNILCLVVSGPEYGTVYFWDHELDSRGHNRVYRIAREFVEFLNKLTHGPQLDIAIDLVEQACENGDLNVVEEYLSRGGDAHAANTYGQSLAQLAAMHNHLPVLKLLAEHGASANNCLLIAAENNALEVAEFLLLQGADVNEVEGTSSDTPLLGAAGAGDVQMVKLLIGHGADLAARNKKGHTAKVLASWGNHHEVLAVLDSADGTDLAG